MIKQLYEYSNNKKEFILNVFEKKKINYNKLDLDEIASDFMRLNISGAELGAYFSWEDTNIIILENEVTKEYKNSWGSFYITWSKNNWECERILYSGTKEKSKKPVNYRFENKKNE